MSFPKYPAYKDSGVEWIGAIPKKWNISSIKRNSYLKARVGWKGLTSDEFEENSYAYLVTGSDFRGSEIQWKNCYQVDKSRYDDDPFIHLKNGDLLITKDGTIGKLSIVKDLDKPACLNSGIFILRPLNSYSNNFMKWVLYSNIFKVFVDLHSHGSTINHLYQNVFENFSFPLPPLPEQKAIASFLDRECGKIDALIAEQERLIALLAEKRQAVISHAVTKGLNPNAPMKDSGIPWIGMVPEGWEILSLNKVVRDFVDYRGVTPNKVESGIPLITASCIKHGRIDHSMDPVFITEEEYNRRMTRGLPKEGDVILTTEAPLGEVAIVEDELISPGQRMILFKLNEKMSNFYMRAYYLSDIGRQELRSRASGSTASGIRADRLRASTIPVPPLNEQKEICAYIDRKTSAFESLEQQIRYELDLLKERRAALISAAVTGKIDVRAQSEALAA